MWHYGNMWHKWRVRVCLRWAKCPEMLKNAIAYAEICKICDYMRIFANLCINKYSKCINKYSKFWKCHYMRENMRCTFLQNMRNMLRSHDRYKPVSLNYMACIAVTQKSMNKTSFSINCLHSLSANTVECYTCASSFCLCLLGVLA